MSSLDIIHNPTPGILAFICNAMSIDGGEEWLWYLSPGPSAYMIHYDAYGNPISTYNSTITMIGNGVEIPVQHIGNGCIPTNAKILHLNSIFHVSNLKQNVISIQCL